MLEVAMEITKDHVESIARRTLSEFFPLYALEDRVACRSTPIAFELNYESHTQACDASFRRQLQMFLYPSEGIVWIARLFIGPQDRGKGMGRCLVEVAEEIALRMNERLVRVHPRYDAKEFWLRMGYQLTTGNARIQRKYFLARVSTSNQSARPESVVANDQQPSLLSFTYHKDPMTDLPQQKMYEVQLRDGSGGVLSSNHVEATSGDVAARQIDGVVNGTEVVVVLADGERVFEMGVEFWQKRVRRR